MGFMTIFGLAFGLAMDAFSVSLAKGVALKQISVGESLKAAAVFGVFQGGMPLLGWLLGQGCSEFLTAHTSWLALGFLGFLGGKMLWDVFKDGEDCEESGAAFCPKTLLILAFATSIDAMLAGLTLECIPLPIGTSVLIIGLVTFMLCFLGLRCGSRVGAWLNRPAGIFGGLMLIGIGVIMFLERR